MVNIGKSHSGLREVVLIRRFVFVKTLGGCFKTLPLLFLNSTHFLQLFWQLNPLDQVFLIQGIPPIETRCIGKCPFPRHALYKPQTPSESVPTPSLYQPIYIYIFFQGFLHLNSQGLQSSLVGPCLWMEPAPWTASAYSASADLLIASSHPTLVVGNLVSFSWRIGGFCNQLGPNANSPK